MLQHTMKIRVTIETNGLSYTPVLLRSTFRRPYLFRKNAVLDGSKSDRMRLFIIFDCDRSIGAVYSWLDRVGHLPIQTECDDELFTLSSSRGVPRSIWRWGEVCGAAPVSRDHVRLVWDHVTCAVNYLGGSASTKMVCQKNSLHRKI